MCWVDHKAMKPHGYNYTMICSFFLLLVSKCLPAQPVPEEGSERELQLVEPHAEIEDIGIYPKGY